MEFLSLIRRRFSSRNVQSGEERVFSFILIKLIARGRETLFPGAIFLHINGAYKVSATLASPPTYSLWPSRVRGHAGGPILGG